MKFRKSTSAGTLCSCIQKAVNCLVLAALFFTIPLPAEEPDSKTVTPEQRAAHLEEMRGLAKSIRVFEVSAENRVESKLLEQPALAYRDDTRKLYDSTMWVWGTKGRPSAIIAVEYYPQRPKGPKWLFEIVSLSTGRIAAEREPELNWKAREPGLKLQVLAGAPAPAEKATARLAQMRQLRRRFAAHERATIGGRIELQALAAPLHRYQDPENGLLDGAVFAFANGTNPEVLWIIEAHATTGQKPSWQYGMAQMTGAEVFLELDEKQIWKCTDADPPAERDSYINGWMASTKEAPPVSK